MFPKKWMNFGLLWGIAVIFFRMPRLIQFMENNNLSHGRLEHFALLESDLRKKKGTLHSSSSSTSSIKKMEDQKLKSKHEKEEVGTMLSSSLLVLDDDDDENDHNEYDLICGRRVPSPYPHSTTTHKHSGSTEENITEKRRRRLRLTNKKTKQSPQRNPPNSIPQTTTRSARASSKTKRVVVGHERKFKGGQTNNHVNAVFHAMDYAADIGADLVIARDGWAMNTMKELFRNRVDGRSTKQWEKDLEAHLGVSILGKDEDVVYHSRDVEDGSVDADVDLEDGAARYVYYNTSHEMYYYRTESTPEEVKERRKPMLQYLWSNPSRGKVKSETGERYKDMCSVVDHSVNSAEKVEEKVERYSVVHSRWMNKEGCLMRSGSLSKHVHLNKKKSSDDVASTSLEKRAHCLLPASYIKDALEPLGLLKSPIYFISDGKNPSILENLRSDEDIGRLIRAVPEEVSWSGGDMMLGVLADAFIGPPISTFAGNIARARVALGFDPSTNFLFPRRRSDESEHWSFFCDESCLYDYRFLKTYVG